MSNERLKKLSALLEQKEPGFEPLHHADGTCALLKAGKRDRIVVYDEDGSGWQLCFGDSFQVFENGAEEELAQVIREISDGRILTFAVTVGTDREVCGWCEREYIDEIRADYRNDPMTAGGTLCVRAFDAETEEYALGETDDV